MTEMHMKKRLGVRLRALFVEDSPQYPELMAQMMCRAGFDVTYEVVEEAETMRHALLSQEWDVIISDQHMPRFSGLAALGLLRKLDLTIPFILATADPCTPLFVNSRETGAWACHDKLNFHETINLLTSRFLSDARSCTGDRCRRD